VNLNMSSCAMTLLYVLLDQVQRFTASSEKMAGKYI
jgi:hypothetical protein